MKRFSRIVMMLLISCCGFMFTACDDGGGGGSKPKPMDERMEGWWEFEDVEMDGGKYFDGVAVIENNQVIVVPLYADDYEPGLGEEGEAGGIAGGIKMSISSTADKDDSGETLLTGTMSLQDTGTWCRAGDEYDADGTDGVDMETATLDNWYAKTSSDAVENIYAFTDSTLETLRFYLDETEYVTLHRSTAPAVDAQMTGTWKMLGVTEEDYNQDLTIENVAMKVILEENGNLTVQSYDNDTDNDVRIEKGSWGVYTSVFGPKYLVLIITSQEGYTSISGNYEDEENIYRFERMVFTCDFFNDGVGENLDIVTIASSKGDIELVRTSADPGLAAPDAAVVANAWTMKVEAGTYDQVWTFYDDNTFSNETFYALDDTETPGVQAVEGFKGHFVANNGSLVFRVEQQWSEDDKIYEEGEGNIFECGYEIDGSTMSISVGAEGFDMTAIPVPDYESNGNLYGSWRNVVTVNSAEVTLIMTFNSDGTVSLHVSDPSDSTNCFRYVSGTWGVFAIDSYEYIAMTTLKEWNESDDDNTDGVPDPAEQIDRYYTERMFLDRANAEIAEDPYITVQIVAGDTPLTLNLDKVTE